MAGLPRFSAGARWLRGGAAPSARRRALAAASVGLVVVASVAYAAAWPIHAVPRMQAAGSSARDAATAGSSSVEPGDAAEESGSEADGAATVAGGSAIAGLGGVRGASAAGATVGAKANSSAKNEGGPVQNGASSSSAAGTGSGGGSSASGGGDSEPQTPSSPSLNEDTEQHFYAFLVARASEVSSRQSDVNAEMSAFNASLDASTCSQNARRCETISNGCMSVLNNLANTTLHQNGSAYEGSFSALIGMARCLYDAMGNLSNAWDAAAAGDSGLVNQSVAAANAAISEYNAWASQVAL